MRGHLLLAAVAMVGCGRARPVVSAEEPRRPAAARPTVQPAAPRCVPKRFIHVVLAPDGETLLTMSEGRPALTEPVDTEQPRSDESLDVWDLRSGAHVATRSLGSTSRKEFPLAYRFSDDGKTFAYAGGTQDFQQWTAVFDAATWTARFVDRRAWPSDVALSADGRRGAVMGASGGITVFDAGTGRVLASTPETPAEQIHHVEITSSGEVVWWTNLNYGMYPFRHAGGASPPDLDGILRADDGPPFARDRVAFVSATWAGLVDARTGARVRAFAPANLPRPHNGGATAIAKDGARAAFLGEGALQVWDAATGRRLGVARVAGDARRLAFSPDGAYLVAGGQIFRASPLEPRGTVTGELVAFVGDHVLVTLLDAKLVFSDASTGGEPHARVFVGDAEPHNVALGSRFIAFVDDGAARVVRLADGATTELRASWRPERLDTPSSL